MRQIVFFVFIPLICFSIAKDENDLNSYCNPKLYEHLWPDFCLKHLQESPNACSEQHIAEDGNFYIDYLAQGSAEAYVDREIIFRLSSYQNLILPNRAECDYYFCTRCHTLVVRGKFCVFDEDNEYEEGDNYIWYIAYKCKCLRQWHDNFYNIEYLDFVDANWKKYENEAVPENYFDIHHKQFVNFLEQHLKYCSENPTCSCYWPYKTKMACEISDIVYDKVNSLLEDSFLGQLTNFEFNVADFPYLNNRTNHGLLSGLFIHAFFYSQYREVLLKLATWEEKYDPDVPSVHFALDKIYDIIGMLQPDFLTLYSDCLQKHPHSKIYYERGMILFHQGKNIDALNDMHSLFDLAYKNHQEDLLTSDLYLQEGKFYAEMGLYDQAVEELGKAIEKDPDNKEAFFERAGAYFELGDFDLCLANYLASEMRPQALDSENLLSFSKGLSKGILNGAKIAGSEYVPSLLASFYGIGHGLWAFAKDPINVSQDIVNATYACINFIKENANKEMILKIIPELQELIKKWDALRNEEKGEITG